IRSTHRWSDAEIRVVDGHVGVSPGALEHRLPLRAAQDAFCDELVGQPTQQRSSGLLFLIAQLRGIRGHDCAPFASNSASAAVIGNSSCSSNQAYWPAGLHSNMIHS